MRKFLKDSGDKNLTRYLELCEEYQSLLRDLGVSDDTIESIIDVIREASSNQREIAAQAVPARNDSAGIISNLRHEIAAQAVPARNDNAGDASELLVDFDASKLQACRSSFCGSPIPAFPKGEGAMPQL